MGYSIVEYSPQYAEPVSRLIIRNLLEVNTKDYPVEQMRKHTLNFTPEKINEYSGRRKMYVALEDGTVTGTLGVEPNRDSGGDEYIFLTIFVLPEKHGAGIGRLLMDHGEAYVKSLGGKRILIPSSITAHKFYKRLGYSYVDGKETLNESGNYIMSKDLDS